MNVLLLEDRGAAAYYVTRWLSDNGHTVLDAFNPADATSHWQQRHVVPIHCVILDLYLPSDGLSEEQMETSEGGFLNGWVWLRDVVLTAEPSMRNKVIIYSDYIHVLTECGTIPEDDYKGILLIPKRKRSSSAEVIVKRLREIARLAEAGVDDHSGGGSE